MKQVNVLFTQVKHFTIGTS